MGEVGHLIIQPNGPKCGCGNRGCFEAVAAKEAIIDLAVRALQAGKHSIIMDLVDGDVRRITPEIISKAAAGNDRVAIEVYEKIGNFIGIALCNCIVLCDPDRIVLGGGIAAAGEALFGSVRRTVAARSLISGFDVTQIVPAQLGNDAGVLGAAALVWEHNGKG
jgi:glucokinase